MTQSNEPIDVLGMGPAELAALVAQWGGKPFRARQLMRWVHQRG
ncbi:MAG TPA: 23S rRNA (adenine(2503)-C(2))-methyltransferase RlmN, partial [Pusillimonas sp.]|nr:23S rRNA (adenine(2503)-C(2))-methyltransferase RlmN [Pusillimonas sp.]